MVTCTCILSIVSVFLVVYRFSLLCDDHMSVVLAVKSNKSNATRIISCHLDPDVMNVPSSRSASITIRSNIIGIHKIIF